MRTLVATGVATGVTTLSKIMARKALPINMKGTIKLAGDIGKNLTASGKADVHINVDRKRK